MMGHKFFPAFAGMGRWLVRIAPKVGLGLLVLFVLLAIPWTYFKIKWGRQLEAELAALKAQGMPLTMVEAAPKPVPDDQNAAVLYQQVFRVDFDSGQSKSLLSGEEHQLLKDYRKKPDAQLQKQVRELLARPQVQEALGTFRRGSQRRYCVFPVNWQDGAGVLSPHMARFREASQIIAAQAFILAKEGHSAEALDWCQVALRMSEHAASEPTLIIQFVYIALQNITFGAVKQIVSAAEVPAATADRFQTYLREIDPYKTFTTGMVAERALGCGEFARMPKTPNLKLDQLTYLRYMGKQIELAGLPYYESRAEHEALEVDMKKLPPYQAPLTRILCPVFSRAVQKRGQAVANLGLCRIVLALKAYKYERGAYPDTLQQLQQTLDWQLPEDPFSGQDFVYRQQGKGFLLYSIGQDLEDDGGLPSRDERGKWHDDRDIVWECVR